jgi:6-pyruvoyltetrahydropterin/6-carboxytetrahydropterin synthase
MYSVAVQRDFFARHFLVGGDWGPENDEAWAEYRENL